MTCSNDFEKIKHEVDLNSEIERRTGGTFKKSGSVFFLDSCPFCKHKDCFVTDDKEGVWLWECKSDDCDAGGGSIIDFVMKKEGVDKLEALKDIAEANGITLKKQFSEDYTPTPDPKYTDIFELAADYYHSVLINDKSALNYQLNIRQHSIESLKFFKVGFSDGNLEKHLLKQGFTQEQILEAGLLKERKDKLQDYFFKGLYIYPHLTLTGRIGHFTCKDPNKKYKLQLQSEHKNKNCLFYNMPAFKKPELMLVEGEDDLITVWDKGNYKNVSAIIGSISKEQINYLKQWAKQGGNKSLYTCFDNFDKDPEKKKGESFFIKISDALQVFCYTPKAKEINNRCYNNYNPPKTPESGKGSSGEPEPDPKPQEPPFSKIERLFYLSKLRFNPEVKDIDDLLKGEQHPEKVIKTLIESSEPVLNPLRKVLTQYRSWKSRQYSGDKGELIFEYFNKIGKFFIDATKSSSCCLFYKNKLYEVDNSKSNIAFPSLLYREAGLISSSKGVNEIITVIRSKAYYNSKHIKSLSWIKTEGMNIYFNLCNERNEIIKLSPGNIEIMQNGTNPKNILLKAPDLMDPLNFNPQTDIQEAMNLLQNMVMDFLTCSIENRYFLICTILHILLIKFTGALGIIHHRGGSGAAKSFSAEYLSVFTYGNAEHVTATSAASSFSVGSQDPLIFDDNLEDIDKEKANFLLQVATGGGKTKRKNGTDSDVVREKQLSHLIVTSIHPLSIKGKTEEIISRTNVIEFSKKQYGKDKFPGETIVKQRIRENRNLIWNGIFKLIAYEVLPDFEKKRADALKMLYEEYAGHSKQRLNELYSSLFLICEAVVKYIPHPIFSENNKTPREAAEDILYEWINTQNGLAENMSRDDNDVLNLLNTLADEYRIKPKDFEEIYHFKFKPEFSEGELDVSGIKWEKEPEAISFIASTGELLAAFNTLQRTRYIQNPYSKTSVLSSRITNSLEILQSNGWDRKKNHKRLSYANYHKYTKRYDVK